MKNRKNDWWALNNNMIRGIIKNNIENNDYYEKIKIEYFTAKDKQDVISAIFRVYDDDYNAYFSIYTIMDSIEDTMEENENYSIYNAIENLTIKEMY